MRSSLLFGSIALELINPQITRFFIDTATSGRAEVFSTLLVAGLAYIGLAILHQSMRLAATNDLRADLALHLLKLDLGFHNARTPGELIERVDGDVGQLNTKSCVFLHLLFGPSLVRALNLFSLDSFTEE